METLIKKLIEKYQESKNSVVNPDDLTWDDLGFDEPWGNFKDVDDYLENGGDSEFDEGEQTEIRIYGEIIEDLESLLKDLK